MAAFPAHGTGPMGEARVRPCHTEPSQAIEAVRVSLMLLIDKQSRLDTRQRQALTT
ncbi:hypothetical protein FHU34_114373 [Micromonospora taraxaci]|uniref:Uncharacterized protein n=1 Tax=Micromonospora taraxaci TaxID=1316803 RepID=A0A561W570_9ACTN|nr:hypothetical protein FHU34_114373 [Micromonospora taraxaci]